MANNIDDFFSTESSGDYSYSEFDSDPIYEPEQNRDLTESDKKSLWIVVLILTLLLTLVLGTNIYDKLTGEEYSGIKPISEELGYDGYTYSELAELKFEVQNINRKDVSENTKWYLNDQLITEGSNSTYLDMSKMVWGVNKLNAVNGDITIPFRISMKKSQSSTDYIHNMLSMCIAYPDTWYKSSNTTRYKAVSYDELNKAVKRYSSNKSYSDGRILQRISIGDISLIQTTGEVYRLNIIKPSGLPSSIQSNAVEVYGSFENVESARLAWDLGNTSKLTHTAYKYDIITNTLEAISSDELSVYNNELYVTIDSPGIYTIVRGSKMPDLGDSISKYDYINCKFNAEFGTIELDAVANTADEKNEGQENKTVYIVDCEELTISEEGKLVSFFLNNQIEASKVIILNATTSDLDNLLSSNTVQFYQTNSENLTTMIDDINNESKVGKAEVKEIVYNGENINVLNVYNTGFDITKNGWKRAATFNQNLQGSNTFGQSLLSKLIFTGDMRENFTNSDVSYFREYDYSEVIPDCKLGPLATISYSALNSSMINWLIENGINEDNNNIPKEVIETAIEVMSYHQLTVKSESCLRAQEIEQTRSPDFIVNYLIDYMNENGPALLNIENNYGSTTVLLTNIYKSLDYSTDGGLSSIVYYLGFYDPMVPEEEQIARLEIQVGMSQTGYVGYFSTFNYSNNIVEYNDFSIVNDILINFGQEISYSEG